MSAFPKAREFRLSAVRNEGVRCDADGAFVADVALLARGDEGWSPRGNDELSKALSDAYGLPVDLQAKRGGLSAIANALNEGDVARAQIATLLLELPDPLALAKRAITEDDVLALVFGLAEARILKFDQYHYPAHTPGSKGGQFALDDEGGGAPDASATPGANSGGAETKSARKKLAEIARSSRGSKDYLQFRSHGDVPAGPDKCNIAVADWIEQAGLERPQVSYTDWRGYLFLTRAPSAHEWADPNVSIPGWSAPMPVAEAQPGDVIAEAHGNDRGHVGVVVGPREAATVSELTIPSGVVEINDWGFRPFGPAPQGNGETGPGQRVVVRRYVGDR